METPIDPAVCDGLLDAKGQRLIEQKKRAKKWRDSAKGKEYQKKAHAEWRKKTSPPSPCIIRNHTADRNTGH